MRVFVVWEAAAVLRHDVRNKLAAVRNAGFYLRRKITAEAAELCARDTRVPTFLDLIRSEVDAADAMLGDRMPSLAREAEPTDVDLAAVARDAAAAIAVPDGVAID